MMDYEEPRLIVAKRLTEDRKNLSQHPKRKRRRSFLFQEPPGPIAKQNQEKAGLPEPTGFRPQLTEKNNCSSPTPYVSSTKKFTFENLQRLLFDQTDIQEINVKRPVESQQNECFWCDATSTTPGFQCPLHEHNKPTVKETLPLALRSLPPEVGLCTSTMPGQGYGICAKRKIPVGAWIGPYEGKFVKPEELSSRTDTTYMWEIFKNGTLAGYIDGSDVNLTSWMRFIRCARHKQEQNLFAFQYLGRIFYRAFKTILPGEEMLVWYDEKYPQYLGIPWMIFDLAAAASPGTSPRADEIIVVSSPEKPRKTSTQESIFPSPPPSPLSKPTSPWTRISTSLQEKRSLRHSSQDDRTSYNKTVPNLEQTPVKHVQKNGTPPTYTAKCKYSVCKKRTITTNRCCRGQNPKFSDKIFGTQVQQTLYHCSHGAASFTAANQLRKQAVIPGRKESEQLWLTYFQWNGNFE